MSLTRGFTRWFGQFIHLHTWSPWRARRLVAEQELKVVKVRKCEVCGQEQMKELSSKEKGFWA